MVDHTKNELWQAFFTEVSEQLDNLELILVDPDAVQRADIHQLFRDFHTIKSSCAMMDFFSMERIAHASEDYLDLIRKGRASLDTESIAVLLQGIDWLKTQLQITRNSGEAPTENPVLHKTLLDIAASIIAATTQAGPVTPKDKQTEDVLSSLTEYHLSDDELTEFSSACREELLASLAADADPVKAKRSLNKLVAICNLVGFTALSSLLKKYIKLKTANEIRRSQETVSDILDRLQTIEHLYQADCGSAALHTLFLDALFPDFAQSSGRLEFILDAMEEHSADENPILQCETLLHSLSIYASLFGFHQLKNFYRYTLQTIRSIRRGDIPDRKSAFYALRQAFDFPAAEQLHAGETPAFRENLQQRQADLNVGIAQSLYSAGHDHARETIANILEIDNITLDLLMPGSLTELYSLVQAGKPLSDIVLDMDCDPALMDRLIQTITETASIIHNRSVFNESPALHKDLALNPKNNDFTSSFCFLVAPTGDHASLVTALNSIDTHGTYFRANALRYRNDIVAQSATAKPTPAPVTQPRPATLNATLRIESQTLDNLVTQVGEMIMIRNMMAHAIHDPHIDETLVHCMRTLETGNTASLHKASAKTNTALSPDVSNVQANQLALQTMNAFIQTIQSVNGRMLNAISAIQARILDLRVIPIASVFDRIPQLVRKMAETQQKDIRLVITGKEVRIDKGMVDILMEPLIHLVRNCIDHGIESPTERLRNSKSAQATLTLSAFQEGSTLVITIADDGRGINVGMIRDSAIRKGFINVTDALTDAETYKLIFLPGFSTAETITETSGRGVGMDVVITRINYIGGDVDVQSKPGHGTRFTLKLPLSAAIQGVVLINTEDRLYAMPQNSVIEVVPVKQDDLQLLHGQSVLRLRDRVIPAFRLNDLVLQRGAPAGQALYFEPLTITGTAQIMILQQGTQRIAVQVDTIEGREDVFIRGLHKDLRSLHSLSGAAVLGNGKLVFILNSAHLMQQAGLSAAFRLSQQNA